MRMAAATIARRSHGRCGRGVATLVLILSVLAIAPAFAHADFQVGLQDPGFQAPTSSKASRTAFSVRAAIHGSTVRLSLSWPAVAPGGNKMPSGFNAANPADPDYNWSNTDLAVRTAAQRHVRVLLLVTGAPTWAQPPGEPKALRPFPGPWEPRAADFAEFMRAAALRYSGSFPDPLHPRSFLPRVKYWEIFNEENLPLDLVASHAVAEYRSLLNAAYGALKSIHSDNVVVLGGLSPVALYDRAIRPLKFAADLMCLRRAGTGYVRSPTCPQQAHFDIFAIHPYSPSVTPTEHAYYRDDVLVADMGKVRQLVRAADALHTIAPRITHQIWVTEWAWFTNPPNKVIGDSYATSARDVAYSMYEMWASGVSLVIWFQAADQTPAQAREDAGSIIAGGGLYTSAGKPKPTVRAFAFPLIASVSGRHGFVWGRAPVSQSVRVTVQRLSGGRWHSLASVRTASDGVFEYHFRAEGNGTYRAVVDGGPASQAYNSKPIPPGRRRVTI